MTSASSAPAQVDSSRPSHAPASHCVSDARSVLSDSVSGITTSKAAVCGIESAMLSVSCGDCHGNVFPVHITGVSSVDLTKPGAYTVYFNCENRPAGAAYTDQATCTGAGFDWIDDGHCAYIHESNTKDEIVASWAYCPQGSYESDDYCIKNGLPFQANLK